MEMTINPLLVQQSQKQAASLAENVVAFRNKRASRKKEKRELSEILGIPGFEQRLKTRGTEFLVLYKDMQRG